MQQGANQRSDNLDKRPRLLVVLTGADTWTLADGTRHPTGFWAEEFVEPMRVFRDAGVDLTVATPGGVTPTVDDASLSPDGGAGGEDRAAELRAALDALGDTLAAPATLEDISPADFEGVFVPGGHGPMEDLAESPELGRLLTAMLDDDKVIAAVCHGPAALLSAERDDGSWAFSGRELSAFTNEEETQAGLAGSAPWLLEDRLGEAGGNVATAQAWQPFSIVDQKLGVLAISLDPVPPSAGREPRRDHLHPDPCRDRRPGRARTPSTLPHSTPAPARSAS